ncbi:MAG: AlpA family phage regulatory protein [Rhodocyclaceae bacterium]|nr:AlpA family phage regulatory protein [Rhodocyclaceae bacterium]
MANLIRITAIAEKLGGIHESHVWRKLGSDPKAPKPIRLGARHTVFDEGEIDRWISGLVEAARGKPVKAALPSADDVRKGAVTRKAKRDHLLAEVRK